VRSTDKKAACDLFFTLTAAASGWLTAPTSRVTWGRYKAGELDILRMGRKAVEIHEVTDDNGTRPDASQVGHAE
jgi:hypothetical protein